jgi:tetratricopeptide (TPR) repeat protein
MTSLIPSRSEHWRFAVLVLVMVGLAPLPAVGVEVTQEAKAQARVKFSEGNEAYARGEFRKALSAFDAAYNLAPLPGFLFNVAQCHRQLGAFERAAFFYRRYLALSEKEPTNAGLVKELIAEMEAKAREEASLRVEREKPGMQAKAVEKEHPPVPPTKSSEARAESKQRNSSLKKAERRVLDIRSSSVASKSLPPAAVPRAPAPKARESLSRKWWVWAGAGATAILAGGIIYAATAPEPRPTTLGTVAGR